jgi:hypothetical protein
VWLYFPLLLFRVTHLVATSGFRDWRLPLLYLAALVACIAWIGRRRRESRPETPGPSDAWRFVVVFWLGSYFVWLGVHGIYRYLMPLELLSGALLLICLRWIVARRWLNAAIVVVTVVVIASTRYPHWERVPYGDAYVQVGVPPVAAHAAVLLVDDEPMSHVLPFFPRDARFLGVRNNLIDPAMTNRMATEIARAVRDHDGPLYALAYPPGSGEAALLSHHLRRLPETCAAVTSNLTRHQFELCRLERTGGKAP